MKENVTQTINENVTQTINENEILHTEPEAAKKYRLSTVTLYRARITGRLKFYKIGTKVLISEKHLQDFFNSCEQN